MNLQSFSMCGLGREIVAAIFGKYNLSQSPYGYMWYLTTSPL